MGDLALVYCPHKIIKIYDVEATSVYALPHRIVTWMLNQRVATMSEPHGEGSSRLSNLDEVDVALTSCPEQPYVHYNLSIITKRNIVIVVLYD